MLLAVQQHFVRAAPMSATKLYSFVPPSLIAPCSQLFYGDVLAHNCKRTNPFLCAQSHRQLIYCSLGSIHSYVTPSFQPRAVHPLPSVVMLAVRPSPAFRGCIGTKHRLCPMPHSAPPLCAHRSRERLLYWSPQALALAVRFRSFVPHSLPRPFTGSQNQIQHLG
jgi:hypothetical protein